MARAGSGSGISVVSALVSMAIVGLAFVLYSRGIETSRALVKNSRNSVLAEVWASELLELFRAMTTTQTLTYLSKNPYYPGAALCPPTCTSGCPDACFPYTLCSHVNLLDRSNASTLNQDPLAQLPPLSLDGGSTATATNRFYFVQVVDVSTLTPNTSYCGQTPTPSTVLATNERLFVTVGVTWVLNQDVSNVRRVSLTTLIP